MHAATNQYKQIMDDPYRYRPQGYMTVSIAVVNNEAQGDAEFSDDQKYAYWSNLKLPLTNDRVSVEYVTLEQNFFRADGTQYIMPEDNALAQFLNFRGMATQDILGSIKIDLGKRYDIKGLTVDFGDSYPKSFKVSSEKAEYEYTIVKEEYNGKFETTDLFGTTNYILITPIEMYGGNQRLRIHNILLGVGLIYTNNDIESVSMSENVSSFSESLPSYSMNMTVFDPNNEYDVDIDNSFANFLHTGQTVNVSAGLMLDDGTIEWMQMESLLLSTWKVKRGKMTFTAKDKFAFMDGSYSDGNFIGEKNLYETAVAILEDAGFERDEFIVDDYLRDITITNPIPIKKHKECLQLIANAARCKLYQNYEGKICIIANFANVLEPEDISVSSTDFADYSKPANVVLTSNCLYATYEKDFYKANGTQYLLPETSSGPFLETSYVSDEISDENGFFTENPKFSLILPAAYSYYSISISFYGNPPQEMKINTYHNDEKTSERTFYNLSQENFLSEEFYNFNRMEFEFVQAYPHNRIEVNKIVFGDLSDYVLKRNNIMEEPMGYREEIIKTVSTRVISFQNDDRGVPQQIDDNVWVDNEINSVGVPAKFENPLIGTKEHAELVNEWLSEQMMNNVTYDVKFRGEPRLDATDIIFMEGNNERRIQCEIESSNFKFNGAFSGTLSLRKMKVGSMTVSL